MYAGVDWAGKGWFAVFVTEDGLKGDIYPTLWNLWQAQGDNLDRLLVDIPIGLCEATKRRCDVASKEYLDGPQQRSVFYTPIRDAVYARGIEAAKECHRDAGADFGVQNQAWSLVPRIRETDVFVANSEDSGKIGETHPEACFVALNGGESLTHSKQSEAGIDERLEVLTDSTEFEVRRFYEDAYENFREPEYAPMIGGEDDIVDALVAAITAASTDGNLPTLPAEGADRDEELSRDIEIKLPAIEGERPGP